MHREERRAPQVQFHRNTRLHIAQHGHTKVTGWPNTTNTLGQDTANRLPLAIDIVEKVALSHRAKRALVHHKVQAMNMFPYLARQVSNSWHASDDVISTKRKGKVTLL